MAACLWDGKQNPYLWRDSCSANILKLSISTSFSRSAAFSDVSDLSCCSATSRRCCMLVACNQTDQLQWVIIIAECKQTIVAFSFVVLFNRGRSLVIALSLSLAQWRQWRESFSKWLPSIGWKPQVTWSHITAVSLHVFDLGWRHMTGESAIFRAVTWQLATDKVSCVRRII